MLDEPWTPRRPSPSKLIASVARRYPSRHRQRLQRRGVEHGEDGGVDADRQRNRDDGGEAEPRRLAQQPQREAQILRDVAEHGERRRDRDAAP